MGFTSMGFTSLVVTMVILFPALVYGAAIQAPKKGRYIEKKITIEPSSIRHIGAYNDKQENHQIMGSFDINNDGLVGAGVWQRNEDSFELELHVKVSIDKEGGPPTATPGQETTKPSPGGGTPTPSPGRATTPSSTTEAPGGGNTTEAPGGGNATEAPGGGNATEAPGGGNTTEAPGGGNTTEAPGGGNATEAPGGGNATEAPGGGSDIENEALKAHNKFRKIHDDPPMKLNATMSKEAQKWAEKIAADGQGSHSNKLNGAGENWNIACQDKEKSPTATVTRWYNEVCDPGFTFGNKDDPGLRAGHFTQVVWKESTQLGYGKAVGKYMGADCEFHVGRYRKSGNWGGKFKENVEKGSFKQSYCDNLKKNKS